MTRPNRLSPSRMAGRSLVPALVGAFVTAAAIVFPANVGTTATVAVGIAIPDTPSFVVAENKPNVLFVLDNSNSMDEDASGAAVGSASANSKSEIARGVLRSMLATYQDRMSVGLMTYKQNSPSEAYLYNAPYDVSYNPQNYDPNFKGDRASATKRFRVANSSSPGDYVYFNVNLPYYSTNNEPNSFCYSEGSRFPSGPNQQYTCYTSKTGPSDGAPPGSGYGGNSWRANYGPTDSDYAQGISSFGQRIAQTYVSRTWMRNDSPGRGYLNVPIKPLDSAQSAALLQKLACNIPGAGAPCDASNGIKNAGLTPIEGTLDTAKDYFSGTWTTSSEGYTSTTYPLPVTCAKNYVILLTDGLPSTDKDGRTVTSAASALTQAAAAAARLKAAGITVYVVGFALPVGTDPDALNDIAASGGTTRAFMANDQTSLNTALESIFSTIEADGASSGATVANSTSLDDNTRLYQANFNSSDWSGGVRAFEFTNGALDTTPSWTASVPAKASRSIYTTFNGTSRSAFTWSNLSPTQQADLGSEAVFNYIVGDRSNEGTGATNFRVRSTLLGDVVYSTPAYIQEPASGTAPAPVLPAIDLLMVGANDGMFHAFVGSGTVGTEKFAYVPRGINLQQLKKLSEKSYNKAHKYFVDGPVVVSRREETSNRNIVVGTLGRGGLGAFALDVTDPDNPLVLWDKTGPYAPAGMGKVLGAPFFGKYQVSNNTIVDAVFIPNGVTPPGATYANFDKASLFVVNAVTGAVLRVLTAYDNSDPDTVSNGLSAPAGWDNDGDDVVDVVYAGDLRGNLWRWDLSDNSDQGSIMFRAVRGTGSSAVRQPISGGVSVSVDTVNFKRWLHFGTGRFLTASDFTNRDVQSIYAVQDNATGSMLLRADLKARTITGETIVNNRPVRQFEAYAALDTSKKGWYIDLIDPVLTVGAVGERVTGTPQNISGQLRVSTGIPGVNACAPEGRGFLYFLDAYSGTGTQTQVFDTNGDGKVDDDDKVDGRPAGGVGADIGLHGDAVQMGDVVVVGGTKDARSPTNVRDQAARGRLSWRELIRD